MSVCLRILLGTNCHLNGKGREPQGSLLCGRGGGRLRLKGFLRASFRLMPVHGAAWKEPWSCSMELRGEPDGMENEAWWVGGGRCWCGFLWLSSTSFRAIEFGLCSPSAFLEHDSFLKPGLWLWWKIAPWFLVSWRDSFLILRRHFRAKDKTARQRMGLMTFLS